MTGAVLDAVARVERELERQVRGADVDLAVSLEAVETVASLTALLAGIRLAALGGLFDHRPDEARSVLGALDGVSRSLAVLASVDSGRVEGVRA